MTYTADKPRLTRSSEELRATIPGWGVDLDLRDRPAVPKEHFDINLSGAHWDFPERQPEHWSRERSPEHKFLTPVFGTACPPKGASGVIRKYAYRFSEGRLAHWLLLLAADRVDVVENRIGAALYGEPDNVLTETGVLSELRASGAPTRIGQHRADTRHNVLDLARVTASSLAPELVLQALGRIVPKRHPRANGHSVAHP